MSRQDRKGAASPSIADPDVALLSDLLNEVAGLECQALVLERRIIAQRIAIADWYTAHPIVAVATWELRHDRDQAYQKSVLGE